MNTLHETDDRKIARQAAQWRETMQSPGPKERAAFVNWLLESRRNVRNYLLLTAFDRELTGIDPQRRHDVDALLREAGAALPHLPSDRGGNANPLRPRGRSAQRLVSWAAAATLAAIALWWAVPNRAPTYATAIGEQRSIPLADGTVIQLNTRSRVHIEFTREARDVRLIEGEALFTVRPDPARPFRVKAGNGVIQALGTQFNVYRNTAGVTVSVVEGLVEILPSGTRLHAGEQAQIFDRGKAVRAATADVPRAIAWRERTLVFRNDRLEDIVTEFNRYNSAQRIQIEGDAVSERRITGIFAADDPQLLVRFLAEDPDLSVEKNGKLIVIKPR